MGCAVKCAPLNWPIIAHTLPESFSKLNQRVVVATTRSQIKIKKIHVLNLHGISFLELQKLQFRKKDLSKITY